MSGEIRAGLGHSMDGEAVTRAAALLLLGHLYPFCAPPVMALLFAQSMACMLIALGIDVGSA